MTADDRSNHPDEVGAGLAVVTIDTALNVELMSARLASAGFLYTFVLLPLIRSISQAF